MFGRYKVFLLLFLSSVYLFGLSTSGFSQSSETQDTTNIFTFKEPVKKSSTINYFGFILKTILILTIFTGSVYFLFKFITKKRGVEGTSSELMNILAYLPLGPNRFLQIIEIGKQIIVIGNTDSNISFITEISDPDTINNLKLAKSKSSVIRNISFGDQFFKFFNRLKGKGTEATGINTKIDFLKKQRDRLKNLRGRSKN